MSEETTNDLLKYDDYGKPILPSGINVLTILTFIWCSISALLILCTPMINKWLLSTMDKAAANPDIAASKLEQMQKGRTAIELANQNMIPLMVIGLAGVILCFVGALWMRKYKKDGYWMYVAGELGPLIASFFIMGTAQYTGVWSYIIAIAIPVLFVILYTMQRKYLTK